MLPESQQREYLERIEAALQLATQVAKQYTPGNFHVRDHGGRNVVTEVDHKINAVLHDHLLRKNEGWLSEEDFDNPSRLPREIVWVVDPLDGTREFVDGIPEWCISIGLVVNGVAVAGGTSNPATGEMFLGARDCGVTRNGLPVNSPARANLNGAVVLASRSEYNRGEWNEFLQCPFQVRPMGSVAYKLSLVSAGLADATWTLNPKHEWDVAAGIALVNASGQWAVTLTGDSPRLNRANPLLPGLLAGKLGLADAILDVTGLARKP